MDVDLPGALTIKFGHQTGTVICEQGYVDCDMKKNCELRHSPHIKEFPNFKDFQPKIDMSRRSAKKKKKQVTVLKA